MPSTLSPATEKNNRKQLVLCSLTMHSTSHTCTLTVSLNCGYINVCKLYILIWEWRRERKNEQRLNNYKNYHNNFELSVCGWMDEAAEHNHMAHLCTFYSFPYDFHNVTRADYQSWKHLFRAMPPAALVSDRRVLCNAFPLKGFCAIIAESLGAALPVTTITQFFMPPGAEKPKRKKNNVL